MKKIFIREYDATGVVINEFEVIPSEKNKTGRSRIYVETDDEIIFGFKLYDDNSLEILEKKITVNDFDLMLNKALDIQNKINETIKYFSDNINNIPQEQLNEIKLILERK